MAQAVIIIGWLLTQQSSYHINIIALCCVCCSLSGFLDEEPTTGSRCLTRVRVRVSYDCRRLLFLETAPDLHWHATAVVCGAGGRWPMPATLIADDPESRGRGSRGIAAEAIRTP